ncbi:MAG: serine/threonine protein kinase [Myxococcales bacterium]|nr:serine/threonine protein kinase [Myxococcales bacterium]
MTVFGSYSLLGRLAFGGMSEVQLAERRDAPGRRFALKLLLPELCADPERVEQFRAEAELGCRFEHASVARVVDRGEVDGRSFLATEYVSGLDLSRTTERLAAQGQRLPIAEVLAIVKSVAEALHYVHELGLVHHDVNPDNILLSDDGQVKLIDFGVTRPAGPSNGLLLGKVAYAAPEQLEGKPVDRRADVFSLGVVLHELLTGRRLFKRETEPQTLLAVVEARIPPPSELSPELPHALDAVVTRALRREPKERYSSAAELGGALGAVTLPRAAW